MPCAGHWLGFGRRFDEEPVSSDGAASRRGEASAATSRDGARRIPRPGGGWMAGAGLGVSVHTGEELHVVGHLIPPPVL